MTPTPSSVIRPLPRCAHVTETPMGKYRAQHLRCMLSWTLASDIVTKVEMEHMHKMRNPDSILLDMNCTLSFLFLLRLERPLSLPYQMFQGIRSILSARPCPTQDQSLQQSIFVLKK